MLHGAGAAAAPRVKLKCRRVATLTPPGGGGQAMLSRSRCGQTAWRGLAALRAGRLGGGPATAFPSHPLSEETFTVTNMDAFRGRWMRTGAKCKGEGAAGPWRTLLAEGVSYSAGNLTSQSLRNQQTARPDPRGLGDHVFLLDWSASNRPVRSFS